MPHPVLVDLLGWPIFIALVVGLVVWAWWRSEQPLRQMRRKAAQLDQLLQTARVESDAKVTSHHATRELALPEQLAGQQVCDIAGLSDADIQDAETQYVRGCNLLQESRAEGMHLLRMAAGRDLPQAQYELARCLFEEAEFKADFDEVVSLLERAAISWYGPAALFLSKMYEQGLGVSKVPARASEWAERRPEDVPAKFHYNAQLSRASGDFAFTNFRRDLRRTVAGSNNAQKPSEQ